MQSPKKPAGRLLEEEQDEGHDGAVADEGREREANRPPPPALEGLREKVGLKRARRDGGGESEGEALQKVGDQDGLILLDAVREYERSRSVLPRPTMRITATGRASV